MPTVPGVDPAQLQAVTQGQWEPDVPHLMMAASDMHARGRLIEPQDQSPTRTGGNMKVPQRGRSIRKRR